MQRSKRHSVVLLFTDLTASTRLASGMEPEEYGDLLEKLRAGFERAVDNQGGEIIRIDGDGMLCMFGYPVAYEDAGRRAVRAALDAHRFAADLQPGQGLERGSLLLHSGIHAGSVLLRKGDLVRGRYEVLGDATNVAARVCDAARPGEVLVTAETIGRDRDLFDTGSARTVEAAGHEAAFPVIPVKASRKPREWRGAQRQYLRSALIGRADERRAIAKWLGDRGRDGFVTIQGPPGIGKSRLLASIGDEARKSGWKVATGGCEAYLGSRPMEPFLQIAGQLGSGDVEHKPKADAAILENIENARCDPVLLLLDDWQWADEKSREILVNVLALGKRSDQAQPLKILLASREEWPREEASQPEQVFTLGPWTGAELDTAIAKLLPACDALTAATVKAASGGTPLLLEEVCHALTDGRALDAAPVKSAWYELAVQSRIESLAPEDAELLRLCSVIGLTFPIWLLAAAIGKAVNHSQLERLEQADFLALSGSGDTIRFKHGMTRDAVYAGLGLQFRTNAHRTLAAIFDTSADKGTAGREAALAKHLFASGQVAKALPHSLAAADDALAKGALDRAQFHYREAFNCVRQMPPGAAQIEGLRHIIKNFGRASVVDPMPHHIAFFEQLLESAKRVGDAHAIALATYWIGSHYYGLGEPRRSLAWLNSAHKQAVDLGASTFAVQIGANLGQSSAVAGHYPEALRYMDAAIETKMRGRDTSVPSTSLAYCLSSRGLVKADMGDFEGAIGDFDASIEALVDMDHPILPSLETQRCLALIYFGHYEEAARRANFSERMSERTHARFLVFSSKALGNYARFRMTGRQENFHRFAEATLRLASSGRLQRISYKYAWISKAMAETGATEQARLFASLALRRALKGDRLGEAIAARSLARLSAGHGDDDKMQHYLAMAGRAARVRMSLREEALNERCAGECFDLLGDLQRSAKHFASAGERFRRLGMMGFDEDRPPLTRSMPTERTAQTAAPPLAGRPDSRPNR